MSRPPQPAQQRRRSPDADNLTALLDHLGRLLAEEYVELVKTPRTIPTTSEGNDE